MLWGVIGRNFRGAFYVVEKESEEEKQRAVEYLKAKIALEMDARIKQYEEHLAEYEHLKALKIAKVAGHGKIRTGRRPRIPQVQDFTSTCREGVKGVVWCRYGEEVIKPLLRPEVVRFMGQKGLSLNDLAERPLLIQDGASAHSKAVRENYFDGVYCTILDWPGNSPDLNPIEHI